nr:MAG TPA: hypothetical protein [Caudoviricetes sp.]
MGNDYGSVPLSELVVRTFHRDEFEPFAFKAFNNLFAVP